MKRSTNTTKEFCYIGIALALVVVLFSIQESGILP